MRFFFDRGIPLFFLFVILFPFIVQAENKAVEIEIKGDMSKVTLIRPDGTANRREPTPIVVIDKLLTEMIVDKERLLPPNLFLQEFLLIFC